LLKAEKRDVNESPKHLLSKGVLPGVFYGKKDQSTPISIPLVGFKKLWREAGETSVVKLEGDSIGSKEVLIHDVTLDPIKNTPIHVDFYVYDKTKKIKVRIPLEWIGVSPAVKDLGGILVKVMHEIEVEALPGKLPQSLQVDISGLVDMKSQVLAKDIKLEEGVSITINPETVIAAVAQPKEEEETPSAPIDLSAIEVEKKGKVEEEGEVAPNSEGGDNK
jgi:large subunit ribosomal protein L25